MELIVRQFNFCDSKCHYIALKCTNKKSIGDHSYYYVLETDEEIIVKMSEYIPVNLKDYHNILIQCNAFILDKEHFFKNVLDAYKAIDMLNEKYLVTIKLMEK